MERKFKLYPTSRYIIAGDDETATLYEITGDWFDRVKILDIDKSKYKIGDRVIIKKYGKCYYKVKL